MNYIFDAKTLSFFPVEMKDVYIKSGSWPVSGVEVTGEVFHEFTGLNPVGKKRGANSEGMPCWVEIPPPSRDELMQIAEAKKQDLLKQSRDAIASLQDAVDLDMATDEEKASLLAWKKYRVLLSRVDTSKAPDVAWPEVPK